VILFASVGGRTRPDRRFAGRGAVDGGYCPGARSGENHHLPELQRNALPRGGIRRFTPSEPINCAGGVKRSSNERPLYRLFVGDRIAEGWTPEQMSGWLKSGNEPRLRAIGCETIYAFIYRTAHKAEALVALSDAAPQTPSPASRQSLARHHQGSSVDP
jgi:IS30 family transposase